MVFCEAAYLPVEFLFLAFPVQVLPFVNEGFHVALFLLKFPVILKASRVQQSLLNGCKDPAAGFAAVGAISESAFFSEGFYVVKK